jgi:hypothetical protein
MLPMSRPYYRRAITTIPIVVIVFLGFEILARAVLGPPAIHYLTKAGRDIQTDFDIAYELNSDGTRIHCWPESDAKTRKVTIIGDSFVFGQGVANYKDFSALLSCEHADSLSIQNLGSIGQDFEYYDPALDALVDGDRDVIVLVLYENDITPNDRGTRLLWWLRQNLHTTWLLTKVEGILVEWLPHSPDKILEGSKIEGKYNNPKAVILGKLEFFRQIATPTPARLREFEETLANWIRRAAGKSGSPRVIVTMIPEASTVSSSNRAFYNSLGQQLLPEFGKPSPMYEAARRACQSTPPCQFSEIFELFLEAGASAYHPRDFHWNEQGHRLMADHLGRELLETPASAGE